MDSNRLVLLFAFSVLVFLITSQNSVGRLNDTNTHSRRKRFVVFPEGSTYSVSDFNLLQPTGYKCISKFNIQELYILPTLYLCVFLFISEQIATSASYYVN